MGVRRAVEMVLDAPNKHKNPICTFGPLIHNPQVLDLLREKEISTLEHIPESATGTVLIRAHGVPPQGRLEVAVQEPHHPAITGLDVAGGHRA